jgi:hypothetical protein
MYTVTTQIVVTTTGDGENHTDTHSYTNVNGIPPTQQTMLTGFNTVNVPNAAKGVVFVYPTGANNRVLKGVTGDAGAVLSTSPGFAHLELPPGNNRTLGVTVGSTETWTLIWT